MSDENSNIRALREALAATPENVPLRRHLAESLMNLGKYAEAEKEYRAALSNAPQNESLSLGLARAFYEQKKNSEALVTIEELIRRSTSPGQAYLLHARLLVRAGQVQRAVREYKKAIDDDPELADEAFAESLGITSALPFASNEELVDGRLRARTDDHAQVPRTDIERPRISFKDVGGMDAVKEEIRMKIVHPLTHPEIYKAYGKEIGGGVLLYGPPGCGKTYLARATAGEVRAGFMAIGLNDVLDMWIGNSERNLHELFETARRNKPCVLFFDEVDALGASRHDMRQSAGKQLINQFLSEMDGVKTSNEGVLILAATNAPWHLDSAFRRPGRFDRILFVPPPDQNARADILKILLEGKPTDAVDCEHIAKKVENYSGADLKAVVDLAIEGKLKDAMKEGIPKPLTTKDLLNSAKGVRESTKDWFGTARNYALYSNQSGLYDDILKYLKL